MKLLCLIITYVPPIYLLLTTCEKLDLNVLKIRNKSKQKCKKC